MRDERSAARHSRRIGIAGVVVIVVALVAAGLLYVNPLGQHRYTAHMTNSGGVRPGDEVRIAGIPVGKVASVALDRTLVRLTFVVNRAVSIGSDSTLEVKLLTPLGGHYVALDPKGIIPLSDNVIPPEQTTTPFEINDIIQEATPLIKKIDGGVIYDTFTEVANAANKHPDALRDVLQAAETLTRSLSDVTADYHEALDMANEYTATFVAGRQQLVALMQQFALVGARLTSQSTDIIEFFTLLSELGRILDRAVTFYGREVAPVVNGMDDIFDTLFAHPDRIGKAAEGLGQILRIVMPMLSGNGVTIDESHELMPGQDLCIPNIARQC
jgi:phospholipid/cholesterol/gamma-HCH transport system substrate-binding protein